MAQAEVGFERDIRPLFRDEDVKAMSFALNLASYDDVRQNAEAIYEKLRDGSMPCDGAWPADEVRQYARAGECRRKVAVRALVRSSGSVTAQKIVDFALCIHTKEHVRLPRL